MFCDTPISYKSFFEIPVTDAPSIINAPVWIYWECIGAFMFTRAPIWLQCCLNFYFNIKCYIHLILSFRMHPHELKYFIVYIFCLRSLILKKMFENYIEIQIVVWFSKLFLGMYRKINCWFCSNAGRKSHNIKWSIL